MQSFDGPWTLLKLDVSEKYLMQAIKKQNFILTLYCAFAGSGDVDVPVLVKGE
ncbi:hypothetical protein [Desulfosporosinus sp. I2]|uniref:hypothetical protein n=1 Tax=Desulfosporosinus sp. I2 TaxID=1617025 RepID=UPI0012E08F0A|nr:hypothetical protein [Desulfosporosinus sp. I2]